MSGYQLQDTNGIVIFIITMLSIGLCEELVFRGIILNVLIKKWGTTLKGVWGAVILSCVMFGAFHFVNLLAGGKFVSVLVQAVVAAVTGMYFSAIYLRCNNLLAVIVLHAYIDFASLSIVGLFHGDTGDVISVVNEFSLINLLPCLTYGLPTLFLLRKSKMASIIERNTEEKRETQQEIQNEI